VTLTAIRLLAPHLTDANHAQMLQAARHKSKQEIQELIASINPRPAVETVIRRVAVLTPLAPERYMLQVTLTRETYEKLRRAQTLARHAVPDGDIGAILDRALALLVDHFERRRFAQTASPRANPDEGPLPSRHITAGVKRAVWQRDQGRCAFIGRTGRCEETAFLEFHHVAPYAAGGAATTDNIQLRCRSHNQYEARLFFGDMFVRDRELAGLPKPPMGQPTDYWPPTKPNITLSASARIVVLNANEISACQNVVSRMSGASTCTSET
jgi:hypothetical protein